MGCITMKEEIRVSSPTGLGLRSDTEGFGFFGAPRGRHRKHTGMDYICAPGQDVLCPIISGKIVRRATPFADSKFSGVVIEGSHITIKMFYCDVWEHLIGTYANRGDEIAIAQDVSEKYGQEMQPHIHLAVTAIDPEILM